MQNPASLAATLSNSIASPNKPHTSIEFVDPWGTEDEISQAAGGNGAKSVTGTVILFPIEFNEEYLQMSPLFMESGNGSGEESNYWETSYGIFRKWGIEKEGLSLNDGMNAQTNMYDTPELEAVMRITRRLKLRNKLVFDYGYSLIWLLYDSWKFCPNEWLRTIMLIS